MNIMSWIIPSTMINDNDASGFFIPRYVVSYIIVCYNNTISCHLSLRTGRIKIGEYSAGMTLFKHVTLELIYLVSLFLLIPLSKLRISWVIFCLCCSIFVGIYILATCGAACSRMEFSSVDRCAVPPALWPLNRGYYVQAIILRLK